MSVPDIAHRQWRKSSRSNDNQACIEIALRATVADVRDSKNPAGGELTFPALAWDAFRTQVG